MNDDANEYANDASEHDPREAMIVTIQECLLRFDFYGLVRSGAPKDEFDGEARIIAERIGNNRGLHDVAAICRSVFVERFGPWSEGIHARMGPRFEELAGDIIYRLDGTLSYYELPRVVSDAQASATLAHDIAALFVRLTDEIREPLEVLLRGLDAMAAPQKTPSRKGPRSIARMTYDGAHRLVVRLDGSWLLNHFAFPDDARITGCCFESPETVVVVVESNGGFVLEARDGE